MKVNGMEDLISMTVTDAADCTELVGTSTSHTQTYGDIKKVTIRTVFSADHRRKMWPLFIYIGFFLGVLL